MSKVEKKNVLIIFETSVIRNPDAPFGFINFGNAYLDIKKYIRDNELIDRVKIGVTQMTIDELLQGRVEEYEKELKNAEGVTERFKELPNLDFSIKKDDFDFRKYCTNLLRIYLRREEIIVLKHPKSKTLFQIISRSLLKKAPFSQSKRHSDFGFKDVVIWESILNFNGIADFDKVIFFTNDPDFSDICKKEFLEKYNCAFLPLKDQASIIKELDILMAVSQTRESSLSHEKESVENNYPWSRNPEEEKKLDEFVHSDYFFETIKQYLFTVYFNGDLDLKDVIMKNPMFDMDIRMVDDEVVGRVVTSSLTVKGKAMWISTNLDESNGIESCDVEMYA